MKLKIRDGRAVLADEKAKAASDLVHRAKGILKSQKGIKWDITWMPSGPSGKPSVFIKVGPPKARWDSTWYTGSWTLTSKQDFARAKNSYKLPENVRSVLFNLSVILPTVSKEIPIRFQVWDEAGTEEHLSLRMK